MNWQHLQHEGPTDVISFDYIDDFGQGADDLDDEPVVGELFICPEVASEAGVTYGTSLSHETVLYAVHGMLHLVGYDDHCEADRQQMRRAESAVMAHLAANFSLEAIFANSHSSPDPA